MDRFVLTPALRVTEDEPSGRDSPAGSATPSRVIPRRLHETVSSTARSELEARITELEAAVSRSREEWEPDGSEPEAAEMPERHIFAHATPEDPQPDAEERDTDRPSAQQPETPEPEDDPATADWRGANEPAEQSWPEQTDPSDSPEAEEAPAFRRGRAQVEASDRAGAEHPPARDHAGSGATGGVMIDEAALKELVAQVVREELQGAMGERITRNVRRMVRREIQQALALKDFE